MREKNVFIALSIKHKAFVTETKSEWLLISLNYA